MRSCPDHWRTGPLARRATGTSVRRSAGASAHRRFGGCVCDFPRPFVGTHPAALAHGPPPAASPPAAPPDTAPVPAHRGPGGKGEKGGKGQTGSTPDPAARGRGRAR
jgi:hypothetical protein